MLSKILSAAIKLFLRTQVEQVKDLKLEISGRNQQILQGYIPKVSLNCSHAVYQGLHLSKISLLGTEIAVNLSEVLRGKPLKLLESIWVQIELELDVIDLQNSLGSPLLQGGFSELWQTIICSQNLSEISSIQDEIIWQQIKIVPPKLLLLGSYRDQTKQLQKLILTTDIALSNEHTLCFPSLEVNAQSVSLKCLESQFEIDLGTDVALEKFVLGLKKIYCAGRIKVNT